MSDIKAETAAGTGGFTPFQPYGPRRPGNRLTKWLFRGHRLDLMEEHSHTHPWYLVLWLTGVDYFSTLGYQPGIALLAAGALSPIATAFLVAVTLLCALPMYAQVARRSYVGLGSIAMLENLLPGWNGKLLVLVLLGFAATGFVITMTLSASDAALHAIENPFLHDYLGDHQLLVTIGLLLALALLFLRGFNEAIGLATFVAVPYLLLNLVVLARGLYEIYHHPDLIPGWEAALASRGDMTGVLIASALIFPKLALGLSGFETGVSVMPLIRGTNSDQPGHPPEGRIKNTKKLLATAAADHERHAHDVEFRHNAVDSRVRVPERWGSQRSCHRVSRAQVLGRYLRNGIRRVDHFDPVVRRRIGYGWVASSDSSVFAPIRNGAPLGRLSEAPRPCAFWALLS